MFTTDNCGLWFVLHLSHVCDVNSGRFLCWHVKSPGALPEVLLYEECHTQDDERTKVIDFLPEQSHALLQCRAIPFALEIERIMRRIESSSGGFLAFCTRTSHMEPCSHRCRRSAHVRHIHMYSGLIAIDVLHTYVRHRDHAQQTHRSRRSVYVTHTFTVVLSP